MFKQMLPIQQLKMKINSVQFMKNNTETESEATLVSFLIALLVGFNAPLFCYVGTAICYGIVKVIIQSNKENTYASQ